MTGADKIKSKILDDAKALANENLQKAGMEASEIMEQAQADIREKESQILGNADQEAANVIKRKVAVAQLEGRKQRLQAKQDVIKLAFQKTIEEIADMPDKEYQHLLENLVAETAIDGSGEVMLSARDKKRIDSMFVDNIKDKLSKKGIKPDIKLSDKDVKIAGGAIIKRGNVEINQGLETILAMKKNELEPVVVKILFP